MIELTKLASGTETIGFVIVIDTHDSMEAFKKLVFRATNLWPDAPAEIKSFADEIEHGKAIQDYASQDTSPSAKKSKLDSI